MFHRKHFYDTGVISKNTFRIKLALAKGDSKGRLTAPPYTSLINKFSESDYKYFLPSKIEFESF